ncbi:helix-turn-helix domain-containing protein [Cupriavidus pauculus]|uniref:helix-turn-helix domain-containing protein n=2 Tax=Cupriavidus pauculus TaxID=82633 RepID=UPI0025695D77|nr:helix-turn-helix domain-containing protein [Azospira sp.]
MRFDINTRQGTDRPSGMYPCEREEHLCLVPLTFLLSGANFAKTCKISAIIAQMKERGEDAMKADHLLILTLDELAAYLKIGKRTLYGLTAKGEIPAFKVGGVWRFRRGEIDQWIADQTQASTKKEVMRKR